MLCGVELADVALQELDLLRPQRLSGEPCLRHVLGAGLDAHYLRALGRECEAEGPFVEREIEDAHVLDRLPHSVLHKPDDPVDPPFCRPICIRRDRVDAVPKMDVVVRPRAVLSDELVTTPFEFLRRHFGRDPSGGRRKENCGSDGTRAGGHECGERGTRDYGSDGTRAGGTRCGGRRTAMYGSDGTRAGGTERGGRGTRDYGSAGTPAGGTEWGGRGPRAY